MKKSIFLFIMLVVSAAPLLVFSQGTPSVKHVNGAQVLTTSKGQIVTGSRTQLLQLFPSPAEQPESEELFTFLDNSITMYERQTNGTWVMISTRIVNKNAFNIGDYRQVTVTSPNHITFTRQ